MTTDDDCMTTEMPTEMGVSSHAVVKNRAKVTTVTTAGGFFPGPEVSGHRGQSAMSWGVRASGVLVVDILVRSDARSLIGCLSTLTTALLTNPKTVFYKRLSVATGCCWKEIDLAFRLPERETYGVEGLC